MNAPLDELYFVWLYEQVGRISRSKLRSHWDLCRHLHSKAFQWMLQGDENRAEDGRLLRVEFINQMPAVSADAEWLGMDCSVLEMLIGMSHRLAFNAGGEPHEWFWQLIDNLELSTFNDAHYEAYIMEVEEKLNALIHRTYLRTGKGGLFPLEHPQADQREVEIWYQMSEYLTELDN